MFQRFRDQGDGGSGAPAVAAPATPETPTPATPADSGGSGTEPTVAELKEQITKLNKVMGDQGNEIGEYKKTAALNKQEMDTNRAFMDQLKKSPAETLKSLNLAAGLTVTTPSAEPVTTGDPAADQTAQINSIVAKAMADNMAPVNSMMGTVQETHLATKYGEGWDELAPVRAANAARIQGNHIPLSELAHMVSEFERIPQHLEAAEQKGREGYRAELEQKAKEHLSEPSGQEPHKIPEDEQTAAYGAKRLNTAW